MSNHTSTLGSLLAGIEFFLIWCLWAVFAALSAFYPGTSGMPLLRLSFGLRKKLVRVSPSELLALSKARKKGGSAPQHGTDPMGTGDSDVGSSTRQALSPEEMDYLLKHADFYAFVFRPKTQRGIRALLICAALWIGILAGMDPLILQLAAAALFLYGVCRVAQGMMEVY